MGRARNQDRGHRGQSAEITEKKRERPQGSADSALRYRNPKERSCRDGAQRCCAPTLGVELLR